MTDSNQQSTFLTADMAHKLALCLTYIFVSGCLIRFNKFLMHEDRFPHAMFLTAMHMFVSFVCCLVFRAVSPSSFPSLVEAKGKYMLIATWFLPISMAFAVSLFTSNQAYFHCNVTFLQFMKEANVIITFLMSCAIGLQVMNRLQCVIILWIITGSSFAVSGEMHFVWIGFCLQLVSQIAECSRAVMGEVVMKGGGLRLDPLSYTLFIAPACLIFLIVGNAVSWNSNILTDLARWWHYVIPNALMAFILNVLVASIIKHVSAVGFILAGVCKDMCIVLFSAIFFAEPVTRTQTMAFSVTLTGVFFWSYVKNFPDGDTAKLAAALLLMPSQSGPTERTPLKEAALKA